MIIKCGFKIQDVEKGSDLYKIFLTGGQCVKLWALWCKSYLTDQYFKNICLSLKEDPIIELKHLKYYLYSINSDTYDRDYTNHNFMMKYWDYFNPNIRRKVVLEFPSGSDIKQITFK